MIEQRAPLAIHPLSHSVRQTDYEVEWVNPHDSSSWRRFDTCRNGEVRVYVFLAAGCPILYIGITNSPHRRWRQHRRSKNWWPQVRQVLICTCPTEREARSLERCLIETKHPRYNIQHARGGESDHLV